MAEKTEKIKVRRGDRRDGVWVRDLPAMNAITPHIMPNRADNEAFISVDIDLAPIEAYLAQKNAGLEKTERYTYFHLVCAAIGKAFVLRPKMNCFVVNRKMFQRRDISISFVVKKRFEDKSEEGLAYLYYDAQSTLDSFHADIMKVIRETRRLDTKDTSSDMMDTLVKMPQFLLRWVMNLFLFLDRRGWLPDSVIGTDPYHSSILLSNLGSIGLECGYHHLANWGTNSCFVVVGKKHPAMRYNDAGEGKLCQMLPLGITLDERLADGYYYSRTVKLVKYLLAHPEELEKPAETPVAFE